MERMTQKIVVGVIAVVLIGALGAYFFRDSIPFLNSFGETPISATSFICDQEKGIDASFFEGRADLILSDGRTISLPQMISASGARYSSENETFVFWNKGDTAVITEKGQGDTFANCEVEVPGQPARSTFSSNALGVTVKYPKSFSLVETYQYLGFPKKPISGVKFSVPESMATGTNLSIDSGVAVEQLPRALNCSADIYVVNNMKAQPLNENGIQYSVATSGDAGAGNFYEEIVYAFTGSKPCTAVRYFIHTTAIANYPEGTVREYDRDALILEFDRIRASVQLSQGAIQETAATSSTQ